MFTTLAWLCRWSQIHMCFQCYTAGPWARLRYEDLGVNIDCLWLSCCAGYTGLLLIHLHCVTGCCSFIVRRILSLSFSACIVGSLCVHMLYESHLLRIKFAVVSSWTESDLIKVQLLEIAKMNACSLIDCS